MAKILIVYCSYTYPLRAAVADHLYSFQRYSSNQCYYLNIGIRGFPRYLRGVKFDLIVFHTIFLSVRWNLNKFQALTKKVRILKDINAVKIALPQDEFLNTDVLCDFINEFGVEHVFSAAPESEWPKIYHKVDFRKVRFYQVLTGYLDDFTIDRITALSATEQSRTLDIGYRAWKAKPWLGRHGYLKAQIAECFQEVAPKKGLRVDISLREEDTFFGDSWYQFLLRCKYTIGVEGGAGILDRDGTICRKTEAYLKHDPQASFAEIEEHCFAGLDGILNLFAISPRHLEACATRTCQILIEGEYNGILYPGIHYIELKSDFSNLEEVLEIIRQDSLRNKITEQAYDDIVKSRRFAYTSFVDFVLGKSLQSKKQHQVDILEKSAKNLVYRFAKFADSLSWGIVAVAVFLPPLKILRRYLLKLIKGKY